MRLALIFMVALAPGLALAQAPGPALGPLQALVSITAPTMYDIGLAETCGFIQPGTASQMQSYLEARVRKLGGQIGGGRASLAAASGALNKAFAAGTAGRGRAACVGLAVSADRMRGLYDLRNHLPPSGGQARRPPHGLVI